MTATTVTTTCVRRLPVHERFMAWQGEGVHMGRSAFFIRLYGCPVQCPWCDSAGTWHPDHIPRDLERYTPTELAAEAAAAGAALVVITGGEPTIHNLTALTAELHARSQVCHLETSGGFTLHGDFDWITLSPKWAKLPLPENMDRADELKLIIDDEQAVARWLDWLGPDIRPPHVWLHPEWSQRANPAILNAINTAVKERGDPFRAGYQLHKWYAVDEQDPRARKPVAHRTLFHENV